MGIRFGLKDLVQILMIKQSPPECKIMANSIIEYCMYCTPNDAASEPQHIPGDGVKRLLRTV